MTRKQKWFGAAATLLFVTTILAIWGFWVEPRRLIVSDFKLAVPNWPNGSNHLRVAVLSDLHVGSPHHGITNLREIVDTVNARDVDIVLLLGDFVIQGVAFGRFVTPEAIANELQRLESRAGTFAVLGNHDWWLDGMRVRTAMMSAGITVLEDSATHLIAGAADFWLAGVSDFWEAPHDVARALSYVTDARPVIVFTHNPDIFPAVPARISLTIAGHTHGGQVSLPFIGPPIVPSDYGQRYAKGQIIEQERHLFVSSGTGTSILPVRFRVPPEIAILNISRRGGAGSE